jgi:uncharacterized protein
MFTKEGIIKKLRENLAEIAEKYDLDFLILFGSFARGKARPNSDIDIGVFGNLEFDQELELAGKMSEILKSDHIDFVNFRNASPLLAHTTGREAVLIYEKRDGLFKEFKTYAFKKYVETKPLRDINFKRTLDYINKLSATTA